MKKRILLVGGRSKAKSLAESLSQRGYQVGILNKVHEDCEQLAGQGDWTVLEGDGTKLFVLEDSEVEKYEMVIALTPHDADNFVICSLAKTQFHVKKTVALLSDAQKKEFFLQMGIDAVVSVSHSIRSLIEQEALFQDMQDSMSSMDATPEILEFSVKANAPIAEKPLWEMALPPQTVITCVLRNAQHIIPDGDTQLFDGDRVILITQPEHREALKSLFSTAY